MSASLAMQHRGEEAFMAAARAAALKDRDGIQWRARAIEQP